MPRRIDRSKGAVVLDPDATFEGFPVGDVMFALLVGVVCRGDNFEDAGFIAAHRSNVVRAYLAQRKIPPGETMARLLASIDPADFVATFAAGVARASSWSAREIIKLHGKSLAGVKGGAALRKGAAGFDAQSSRQHSWRTASTARQAQRRCKTRSAISPTSDTLRSTC